MVHPLLFLWGTWNSEISWIMQLISGNFHYKSSFEAQKPWKGIITSCKGVYYPQFWLFWLSPSTFSSDWRQWRRRQSPFWPCQVRSQGWTGSPCLSGGYTPASKIFVIWQSPGLRKSRLCLLNIKKKRMRQNFDTPSFLGNSCCFRDYHHIKR